MSNICELKDLPAQPTLTVRTTLAVEDMPQFLGKTFGSIVQYVTGLGHQPAGAAFVAYYNMDMQHLDIEAGFPLSTPLAGKNEIKAGEIPAGKYASTLHIGPYSDCALAYDALTKWVAENGYQASGIAYEMYFDGPETPPEKTRTEILFPLK
jgi:effector-binding domain-containing protein